MDFNVASSTAYIGASLHHIILAVGTVFLAVLLAGIPGSKMGSWLVLRLKNPVISVMLCNVGFIVATALAAGA